MGFVWGFCEFRHLSLSHHQLGTYMSLSHHHRTCGGFCVWDLCEFRHLSLSHHHLGTCLCHIIIGRVGGFVCGGFV